MTSVRSIATGRRLPTTGIIGMVEEPEQQQHRHDDRDHASHEERLDDGALTAVGEEQHEGDDDDGDGDGDGEQHQPQRCGNHAKRAMDAVGPRLLPDGVLIEPFAVGGLLARRLRLNGLERPEQLDALRADLLAESAGLHTWPLPMDH